MQKKKSSSKAGWPEMIGFAEAQLKLAKLREMQLKALISVFKAHEQADDPCPSDLITSVRSRLP
jgi:hypothetical protein